jgi:hypothetical protein
MCGNLRHIYYFDYFDYFCLILAVSPESEDADEEQEPVLTDDKIMVHNLIDNLKMSLVTFSLSHFPVLDTYHSTASDQDVHPCWAYFGPPGATRYVQRER